MCEDLLFVIQYTTKIQKCAVLPYKLYNYDIQPNGLTSSPFSIKKTTQIDALTEIVQTLQENHDHTNLTVAQELLVTKTIFACRDTDKAVKCGVLKGDSVEYQSIKKKTKAICRQYMSRYINKRGFPLKFKLMMLWYCLV